MKFGQPVYREIKHKQTYLLLIIQHKNYVLQIFLLMYTSYYHNHKKSTIQII